MSDDPGFLNPSGRAALGPVPESEPVIFDPHESHRMEGESIDDPQRCATCGADDTMPIIESKCCTSVARAEALRRGPTDKWIAADDVPALFEVSFREAVRHPRMPESCPTLTEWVVEWVELNRQLGQRP